MCRAETCGAVTGALMVLGLRFGPKDTTDTSRDAIKSKVPEFFSRFEERCGSIVCRDLLGCDIGTPEGIKYAVGKGLFKSICPKLVGAAAEILEDMC